MARDIQNYKLSFKRALELSDEGELRILIDGALQPGRVENGEMGYGVWKVVVEYSLTKLQGGIVFAGGGDLPGWGARHCYTDGQPGVSALWFPTVDGVSASLYLETLDLKSWTWRVSGNVCDHCRCPLEPSVNPEA